MSARLDEIAGGSSIGGGGKPRGVSSPPRTVGGSQSLSSMSKDDLVDLVSSMVSSQVTALASKLRGDVDKSVGSALQSMHVCSSPLLRHA